MRAYGAGRMKEKERGVQGCAKKSSKSYWQSKQYVKIISESSQHKSTIYEPTREHKKVMFGVVSLTAGIGVLVEGESLG